MLNEFFYGSTSTGSSPPGRSLRFNAGDSSHLSRTPSSASNRKMWTWSGWVKRSNLSTTQTLFSAAVDASNRLQIYLFSDDTILIYGQNSGSTAIALQTVAVYRDPSSWFHLLLSVDTTQSTAADRCKIYINGGQPLDITGTPTYPAQNTDLRVNDTCGTYIGTKGYTAADYADCYLTDVHFIDGQALAPTDFGETDDNGVWQPKEFAGTYTLPASGIVYSNALTASTLKTIADGFNGLTTGRSEGTGGLTFTPVGGIAYTSSVEVYDSNTVTKSQVNGGTFVDHSANNWVTVASGSGTLNTLYAVRKDFASYDAGFIAIRVDGVILTDGTPSQGANSFHLDFKDNSSNAALGTDTSGNSNTWTVNNLSVAAGAGNDSLVDSPTNGTQTDTGLGGEVSGNYCTLNPLDLRNGGTLSNGNLSASLTSASSATSRDLALGTFATLTGKWYFEITIDSFSSSSRVYKTVVGIADVDALNRDPRYHTYKYMGFGGIKDPDNNTIVNGLTACSVGDVIGIAYDLDNQNFYAYLNGTANGSTSITAARYAPFVYNFDGQVKTGTYTANFGQRAFAYTAPSGYKALCTANLPTPTIADGSKYFDTKLYTGTGSNQSLTGLTFQSDFVWIKTRNETENHFIVDSVRGVTKQLYANITDAEYTNSNRFISFDSNGFTVGTTDDTNQSGNSFVAWAWDAGTSTVSNTDGSITSQVRANPTAGFSISSYSGNGTNNATVGHGLGSTPGLVIVKRRNAADDWTIYHKSFNASSDKALKFDTSTGFTGEKWRRNLFSSTVFGLASSRQNNNNGSDYIAYCFTPVEGYSAMGGYTGLTNGPFVYTGFKPAFVLIKETSNTNHWYIYDAARNTFNTADNILWVDTTNSEGAIGSGDGTSQNGLQILSNGFKIPHSLSGTNRSNGTFIYLAFAEHPFSSNGGIAC